nr:RNA-dependent RNA polymerase [Green Sichuan pepper ilarvirus]
MDLLSSLLEFQTSESEEVGTNDETTYQPPNKVWLDMIKGFFLCKLLTPGLHRCFVQFLDTEFAPLIRCRFLDIFDIEDDEVPEWFNDVVGQEDFYYREPQIEIFEEVLKFEEERERERVASFVTEVIESYESAPISPASSSVDDLDDFRPELTEGQMTAYRGTSAISSDRDVVVPVVPEIGHFDTNKLMLVKEVVVDGIQSIFAHHEKVVARNDWQSLAMYLSTGDIPTQGDLLQMPVKHTDPEFVQMAIDEMFPGVSDVDDRFFQELVETSDIALELDRVTIDMSVIPNIDGPKGPRLQGRFNTGNLSKRIPTFREAALAIKKRNLNVPNLQQVMFEDEEARRIANKFLNTVVDPNKLAQFPGYISEGEIGYFNKYLSGKTIPEDVFVDPCCLVSMDKYRHMIKTTVKPVEENSQMFERPLPATITYHDKGKVMSTSPIFLMLCNRLLLCLRDNISIPSGREHTLFSIDPYAFENSKEFKEIDFSKFDKSQQRLHHLIQFHIFTALGASKEFLDMWFGTHEVSHIRDGPCGIGFSVDYQRRTGDACTYLGNTIITLSALAYMYDLLDPNVMFVVASGDDSLIGSKKPLNRDDEFKFTTLFNFEAKFPHNMAFICSKFLCLCPTESGGKKVIAVPNPVKLNIKLGVKDLSPMVFDDWYESWLDNIWYFDYYYIISTLRDYVSHRYSRGQRTIFQEGAMLAYRSIFSNKEKCCKTLFGLRYSEVLRLQEVSTSTKQKNTVSNRNNEVGLYEKKFSHYKSGKRERKFT